MSFVSHMMKDFECQWDLDVVTYPNKPATHRRVSTNVEYFIHIANYPSGTGIAGFWPMAPGQR